MNTTQVSKDSFWDEVDENRFFECQQNNLSTESTSRSTSTGWFYEAQVQSFVPGFKTKIERGRIPYSFIISKVCDSSKIADMRKLQRGLWDMIKDRETAINTLLINVCNEYTLFMTKGRIEVQIAKVNEMIQILSASLSSTLNFLDLPLLLAKDRKQVDESHDKDKDHDERFFFYNESGISTQLIPLSISVTKDETSLSCLQTLSQRILQTVQQTQRNVELFVGFSAEIIIESSPIFATLEEFHHSQRSKLLFDVLLSIDILKEGGCLILGTWGSHCRFTSTLFYLLQHLFEGLMIFKPRFSSKASIERFVICKGFRHNESIKQHLQHVAEAFNTDSRENAVLSCLSITLLADSPFHRYLTQRNNLLIDWEIHALRDIISRVLPDHTSPSPPLPLSPQSSPPSQ